MSDKSTKILIADDDTDGLVEALSEFLVGQGYEVFTAENGKDALLLLERQDVDILISDIEMPEMNGVELGMALKNEKIIRIIVSGYERNKNYQSLVKADLFLSKPFRFGDLEVELQQLLEKKRAG